MSNELSIILPTLNEGKNLEKLIPQIFEILINKNIENNEILVMDDGSTDCTEEMCQSLNNRYGNIKFI
jgi:glycosyltransferase involved in cell wall biosynthesis